MVKHTLQFAYELFERVWPFCGVDPLRVKEETLPKNLNTCPFLNTLSHVLCVLDCIVLHNIKKIKILKFEIFNVMRKKLNEIQLFNAMLSFHIKKQVHKLLAVNYLQNAQSLFNKVLITPMKPVGWWHFIKPLFNVILF